MPARILDGKAIAGQIQTEIAERVAAFRAKTKAAGKEIIPCLAAVLVGDDPASQVYVRNKERACGRVGMTSRLLRRNADLTETELLALVADLNADPEVHGILVQLPLPKQIDETRILDAV